MPPLVAKWPQLKITDLEKYSLISGSQHGFVKGNLCLNNLLSFYKMVYAASDRNENYMFLDFSKAFHRVPHLRPVSKLKAYGAEGKVSRWIKG